MSRRWPIIRAMRMRCPDCSALVRLTSELEVPPHKNETDEFCTAGGCGAAPDFNTGAWTYWSRPQ